MCAPVKRLLLGLIAVICCLAGCSSSSSSKTGTVLVPNVLSIRACDALPMLQGAGLLKMAGVDMKPSA